MSRCSARSRNSLHRWFSLIATLFLSLTSLTVNADSLTPMLVDIREFQPGTFSVRATMPVGTPNSYVPDIRMPEDCQRISLNEAGSASPAGSLMYRCADGIHGKTIDIGSDGVRLPVPVALRIRFESGDSFSIFLPPSEARWQIPDRFDWQTVARNYTLLGVTHILQGFDHLLFVICLLWISGGLRQILLTITGFTLAHSLTLILSAFNLVQIPIAPVEVLIALSILFLAVEVARGKRDTLTWRYPFVISSAFGLLHGLGFAAAIASVGFPQHNLVTGLLFFNIGVEVGQIAFIVSVLMLARLFRLMPIQWPAGIKKLPVYAVGTLSAYWTISSMALLQAVTP